MDRTFQYCPLMKLKGLGLSSPACFGGYPPTHIAFTYIHFELKQLPAVRDSICHLFCQPLCCNKSGGPTWLRRKSTLSSHLKYVLPCYYPCCDFICCKINMISLKRIVRHFPPRSLTVSRAPSLRSFADPRCHSRLCITTPVLPLVTLLNIMTGVNLVNGTAVTT